MDKTPPHSKKCMSCRRNLTINFYGSYRGTKDGFHHTCRFCITNRKRRHYRKRYGLAVPDPIPLLIENTNEQNGLVLAIGLNRLPSESVFPGYKISTKEDVVVFIHINQIGLTELLVHDSQGAVILKYAKGSEPNVDFKDQLLTILRMEDLRLEKSQLDLLRVKNELYYL